MDENEYPEVNQALCTVPTKAGGQCHMRPLKGQDHCYFHSEEGRAATEAKTKHREPEPEPEVPLDPQVEEVSVTEVVYDEPIDPTKLKPYPFHDGGVNENAAIRMISMVQPNCPIDGIPEIKQKDGTYSPNPNYTGEPNCQMAYKFNNQGRWDVEKCVSLGHDPYHTVFRKPILEETTDAKGYVIETKTRWMKEKRLNIIQVSDNPRHTNRTEVALALAKGCKFLEEFGYASPCEFRNCTQPQRVDTQYGKYCSERHARLIAADFKRIILPVGGDPYTEAQALEEREQLLENLNIRKVGV